ncbi:MAG: dipeptidase, partial [Nocardioides sp.]|nr:dipeptidase [Nocardioides sp.]
MTHWDDVVLMSDLRVASLPAGGSDEPLVDVRGQLGFGDLHGSDDAAHVRAGLLRRLLVADRALPDGLRLLVVEGYRPPELQRRYFTSYAARLAVDDPALSPEEVHRLASRYVSPPDVAPHSAGAAVDVTLLGPDGHEVWMGCGLNDSPEDSEGRCYTRHPDVRGAAREMRDVLTAALSAVGLVNYPTEWW